MEKVTIKDREFVLYINRDRIWERVQELASKIEADYRDKNPVLLCVLNGSFIFAADLFHAIDVPIESSFVKLSSYQGMKSTNKVVTALGLQDNLKDRHVLIVEDIIDTGKTLFEFLPQIEKQLPASIKIASFLSKPDALQHPINIDYLGFEIPNKFIVGYGLDYDGQGRNLTHLYQLA